MYIDPFGVSYSDDRKQLIRCPENFSGNYSIAQGTECIASNAFLNCKDIVKIIIPSSVKTIQNDAFKEVTKLSVIAYGGTLLEWMQIRHDAYINCPHELLINNTLLEEIEIPSQISSIGKNVFFYCKGLKSIKFHNGIKNIGSSAFNKTTLEGDLILPEGLETIGDYAFLSCTELKSVEIPASVTKIGAKAFLYCSSLTSINVHPDNSIYSSVEGVLFNKDKKSLIYFPPQHGDFVLPVETWLLCDSSFMKAKGAKTITITNTKFADNKITNTFEGATIQKIRIPVGTKSAFIRRGFPERLLYETFSISSGTFDGGVKALISNNPFRVIGVTSNASAKEIASSANKIKRYLEVGKQMQSPLDLNNLMDPISRSPEIMDKAYSSLSLPKDKIKAALFWFYKGDTPEEETAFNLICEGEYQKALDSYNSILTVAGWRNRSILYFLLDNYIYGLFNIGYLLQKDELREEFIRSVCGDAVTYTEEELVKILIDELSTKIHVAHLKALCLESHTSQTLKDYIQEKTRNNSLGRIESLMRAARDTKDDDYEGLKKIGQELADSVGDLEAIKLIYGSESAQFEDISDGLSLAITNTGVRFAKLVDQTDREELDIARKIVAKALRTPYNAKIKKYCTEQYDAIAAAYLRAPYNEIKDKDAIIRSVMTELKDYNGSDVNEILKLVIKCFPTLLELDKDRDQVYLMYTSEDLASLALAKSIPIVNKKRDNSLVVSQGIELLRYLIELPVGDYFKKEKLTPNYVALTTNTPDGVHEDLIRAKYTIIGDQEEQSMWYSCNTKSQYEEYMRRYPNGKYINFARSAIAVAEKKQKKTLKIVAIVGAVIVVFVIACLIWGVESVLGFIGIVAFYVLYALFGPKKRRR